MDILSWILIITSMVISSAAFVAIMVHIISSSEPYNNINYNIENDSNIDKKSNDDFINGGVTMWNLVNISLYDMYINNDLLDYSSFIVELENKVNELNADNEKFDSLYDELIKYIKGE